MIVKRDEAFRVVCELRTAISLTTSKVGTGMFVYSLDNNGNTRSWIITASHVAKETNDSTQIILANQEGKATIIPLSLLGPIANWEHHPKADIGIFKIDITEHNYKYLENRCFPLDHFNLERRPVSRDYELTSIGFPNGLGAEGSFSPFTFRSYASSGFVTLTRADTKSPSEFFCLENPSVGGYSGCPVFDLGYETNGIITSSRGQTCCHGIMHGTMIDNTGGKIAMVTPAFYIKDML